MNKTYDSIIIGAGPAGITASIYTARKGMDILVITRDIGGQTLWTNDIENYSGFQVITGAELAGKFEEHMKEYGISVKEQESLENLEKKEDLFRIRTSRDEYLSRSAIIASGKRSKELGIPGEKEFRNKGVAYCATCDGPLFRGKNVAVIGGGNSALEAAIELAKIAEHVYLVNIDKELTADGILSDRAFNNKKITVMNDTEIKEIKGDVLVNTVILESGGIRKEIALEGVFIEIGLVPNSGFESDLLKNELEEIKINSRNETSVPGVFAAGDVTDIPEKQIIIAAGEGAKAAISAFKYISRL